MRLIDADQLKTKVHKVYGYTGRILETDLDGAPTIDAVLVTHAHWVLNPNGMDWGLPAWTCSHCGGRNDMIPPFITTNKGGYVPKNPNVFAGSNYCPNCGAKMDEY
jgi:hypothetical protein